MRAIHYPAVEEIAKVEKKHRFGMLLVGEKKEEEIMFTCVCWACS